MIDRLDGLVTMDKFSKILVANRSEIAVRVMRTAHRLGYDTVAVYSDPDRKAPHTSFANQAIGLGGSAASESYLNADKIIAAAKQAGAGAIHPGYGFLSENAEFAQRCAAEDLIFIGPSASAIELMGSKRLSKLAMLKSKVPCIPGYQGAEQDDATLTKQAKKVGLPLMIKASAGGGGRGMRIVHSFDDFQSQLDAARTEAATAFGSDELILERALIEPRHIEIQIFGDTQGNYVHLGERDCSIQRRHQKVVEESPSPFVGDELRAKMGSAAISAAQSCDYVGAGTVEFLVDANGEFFFLEMNTRLQVEHPVTELVTGLDLVEWQILVANGQPLPLLQKDITFAGHAIEVRLCAEDPRADFMPQTGDIVLWQTSNLKGVRTDAGICQGQTISPFYDSMIAKVIASGQTRDDAIRTLRQGLNSTAILGVHSNKHFLHTVLGRQRFIEGHANTAFLAEEFSNGDGAGIEYQSNDVDVNTVAIASCLLFIRSTLAHSYPNVKWSSAEPLFHTMVLTLDGGVTANESVVNSRVALSGSNEFIVQVHDSTLELSVEWDGKFVHGVNHSYGASQGHEAVIEIGGERQSVHWAVNGKNQLLLDNGKAHLIFNDITYAPASLHQDTGNTEVLAAMDGALVDIKVQKGDRVVKGQVVAVLEAMKMAHQLKAGVAGEVEVVLAKAGQQVKTRQVLISITPAKEGGSE